MERCTSANEVRPRSLTWGFGAVSILCSIMLGVVALLCLFQRLDPEPYVCHPGQAVTLRAVAADNRPCPGVLVRVVNPGGTERGLGTTDASGLARFTPAGVGVHELRGQFPGGGPLVLVTYHVVAPPRRWLYAVVLTPLGLVLLWWNVRRLRRQLRPGSSPPAA